MCGINGFSWNDTSLINKMNEVIKLRGPDDQGIYTDDKVSLGNVRLAIIDLSPAGHQPMFNEDKSIAIVFNGEIYNFQEIKEDLLKAGHKFTSNCDTEVIIHSYEQWGYDCLDHFNGMWGFAIYDLSKQLIFIARDRFGVKPVYYYFDNKNIIFSSEIKGILAHDIPRKPNDAIISDYLIRGWIDFSSETFFEGISKLMPGNYAIFDLKARNLEIHKWYNLVDKIKKNQTVTEEQAIEDIKNLFISSIKYRMIADTQVGAALSGGIDSSSIVCFMKDLFENPNNLNTFSVVLPGLKMDESKFMDAVIEFAKVKSFKVKPTAADLVEDMEDFIYSLEEPFQSFSMYGYYRLNKMTSEQGIKVLLNGQGSDEMFAGYSHYYPLYLKKCLKSLKFRESIAIILQMLRTGYWKEYVSLVLRKKVFTAKYFNDFGTNKNKIQDFPISDLKNLLLRDLTIWILPSLLRYDDRCSMRWHVETRIPFLDYRLVEYVMSLPDNFKIKNGLSKYIFRQVIKGKVPDIITNRRDKIGFQMPDQNWLNSLEFQTLAKKIIESPSFNTRKYWKPVQIKNALDTLKKKPTLASIIWHTMNVHFWMEKFID